MISKRIQKTLVKRNYKKNSQELRILINCISFLLVLCILIKTLNYFMWNDNSYARVMMHELYQDENIDLVFAGASLAYRHFDPEIWDKNWDVHSFNTGTSNQSSLATYYLLKEIFKTKHPRYCIYAVSGLMFKSINENPLDNYILFDQMKLSPNKVLYGLIAFDEFSELNGWVPFTRNANNNPIDIMKSIYTVKKTDNYKNYGYKVYGDEAEESYMGRGYVYREAHLKDGEVGKFPYWYDFSDYEFDQEALSYLNKIVDLCKKNDCQLIFVSTPHPYANMTLNENYQDVLDFYNEYIRKYDVPFFDFSMVKDSLMELPDHYFYDYIHLSGEGAAAFSETASRFIKDYLEGNRDDWQEYFYTSYEELLNSTPWVYSVWIDAEENHYQTTCTYGNNVEPIYRYSYSLNDGITWEVIGQWTNEDRISRDLIPEGSTRLKVEAKSSTSQKEYEQMYVLEIGD